MTIPELLAELRGRGITLTAGATTLRYRAPTGVITSELKAELVARKPELIAALHPNPPDSGPVKVRDTSARAPLPEEIKHKRRDCRSTRWWQHVFGDFVCLDCWPPTDPTAVAGQGGIRS